jgi:hypothetical protein
MGSRLYPLCLALGATAADLVGFHGLAGWLVLAAIPCALAAVCDAVASRGWLGSALSGGALALLVASSAVRHAAATGAHVPAVAISAAVGAAILYVLPVLLWVLQPAPLRPAPAPASSPSS